MALHMYRGTGFGGEVAPNLSAISDTVGILGVRGVGAIRGGEDVTSAGGFASSSLRVLSRSKRPERHHEHVMIQ
ncbi:hypothetical protein L914_18003 [Phytophthora nicotianae]|uniref:Uncharacterized protein n=1 Tax=Phytophthora nicotianae TaxID=4792 RepID=W2MH88_PHYNI|nr:hypothetical protein L914_18003 [Phytophthora nicotianae]